MPISSRLIPIVITAAASQFTFPGDLTGDSGIQRHVAAAAISVTSSGIQNSQCQPRCSEISAPSTRPSPPPTPRIEDIRPMLPATRSGGNSSRAIENASGKMPPATPWITRATINIPSEVDTAASSVPNARISSVQSSSFSLPYISPSRPITEVPTDAESRKAVSSQVVPVSEACSSCWKVGNAGITADDRTAYASPAVESTARITFGCTL